MYFPPLEHFKSRWYLFSKSCAAVQRRLSSSGLCRLTCCSSWQCLSTAIPRSQRTASRVAVPHRALSGRSTAALKVAAVKQEAQLPPGWQSLLEVCVSRCIFEHLCEAQEALSLMDHDFLHSFCLALLSKNYHLWNKDSSHCFAEAEMQSLIGFQKLCFISHWERFANQNRNLLDGAQDVRVYPSCTWGYWTFCCIKSWSWARYYSLLWPPVRSVKCPL